MNFGYFSKLNNINVKTLFHFLTLFAVACIIMLVTKETAVVFTQDFKILSVTPTSTGKYVYQLAMPKSEFLYHENYENNRPIEAYISTEWFAASTNPEAKKEGFTRQYEMKKKAEFYVAPDPNDYQAKIFVSAKFLGDIIGNPYLAWKEYTGDSEKQKNNRNP